MLRKLATSVIPIAICVATASASIGKILLIGDSITAGQATKYNGVSVIEIPWRLALQKRLDQNGYSPTFIGLRKSATSTSDTSTQRGLCNISGVAQNMLGDMPHGAWCGITTSGLLDYIVNNNLVRSKLVTTPPDIIILASGTNDLGGTLISPAVTPSR